LPLLAALIVASPGSAQDRAMVPLDSLRGTQWQFGGAIGERIAVNERAWLFPAPVANPGILEMFRVRDREPRPALVDWAGEFAGKYLISAVQALALTRNAELRTHVERYVRELISTQAEDGYLGPFPKGERLLGHWDLWGHYHVIEGLLLWHEATGDAEALEAARKAADLACRIYLDGSRRVAEAGSPEMNMSFMHGLALLHRATGEARYLEFARKIEKEWEGAGDYLRTGLAGVEFFQSPKPRWESLHCLQALFEMWRITGEAKYRQAFEHHWRSILRHDVHNAGSFSSGEQATGNPWAPGAIETCCTIAWMALSVDMLKLTGDPLVADELERSTWNGALGAQHPSGRWWTYNTPMDGAREASAHSIVFQARAGTPELNCCSVNGPRALGMLGDWAVMRDAGGLTVNWSGPLEVQTATADGKRVRLRCETDYPRSGKLKWIVEPDVPGDFIVRFRIPAWSTRTTARVQGREIPTAAGKYLVVQRRWERGDTVELELDMQVRAVAGERQARGKASLFRGPLLLAWDQRFHDHDEAAIPPVDLTRLAEVKPIDSPAGALRPWLLAEVPATGGGVLKLCAYANAGATGTRYRSWLPALPRPVTTGDEQLPIGPDGVAIRAALRGDVAPQFGKLRRTVGVQPSPGADAVRLDGRGQMLVYALPPEFAHEFTAAVRVRILSFPPHQLGQVFSAWSASSDDPLRLVVEKGKLFARVEAGSTFSTKGVPLELNRWCHVAAVKKADQLTLYVDGEAQETITVPAFVGTGSNDAAVGGNPHFNGPEFLHADFRDLEVRVRAVSAAEIRVLARE